MLSKTFLKELKLLKKNNTVTRWWIENRTYHRELKSGFLASYPVMSVQIQGDELEVVYNASMSEKKPYPIYAYHNMSGVSING